MFTHVRRRALRTPLTLLLILSLVLPSSLAPAPQAAYAAPHAAPHTMPAASRVPFDSAPPPTPPTPPKGTKAQAALPQGSGVAMAGAEVLLIPFGEPVAQYDKIWRYVPDAGWIGTPPPRTAWYWRTIAADPADASRWILVGNSSNTASVSTSGGTLRSADGTASPVWVTTDAGTTWASVSVPAVAGYPNSPQIFGAMWSETAPGNWLIWGDSKGDQSCGAGGPNFPSGLPIWQGSATATTSTVVTYGQPACYLGGNGAAPSLYSIAPGLNNRHYREVLYHIDHIHIF